MLSIIHLLNTKKQMCPEKTLYPDIKILYKGQRRTLPSIKKLIFLHNIRCKLLGIE